MDMVYNQATGAYEPAPVQPQQPVQPTPAYQQPAQPVYQQPAQPVYQQPAPAYQQPAPAYAAPGTAVNIFQQQNASTALAFLQDEDDEHSSMDDLGGSSLPIIKMNEMGWLIKVLDGVELPPLPYLDVVILGIGPKGNDVYRTYYEGQYNNQQQQVNPPVCYSYDGKTPAPCSPKCQALQCNMCPMNAENSGPNGSKACKFSKYLVVMDVAEPDKLYRIRLSATPIFSKEVQNGFFPLNPYRTFLASNKSDWEKVITRISCPFGKSGGYRFQAVSFIDQQTYNITKDLKMKLDLTAYLTLNNEQLTVAVNGIPVAQIPVQQVPHIPTAQPAPQPAPQPVVQYAQQHAAPTMTQPMNPAPAVAQAPVQQQAPAPQPAPQPAPAVAPAPAPQPVHQPTLKERCGADQSLPQNVRDWINHPQVTEQQVHDYVAQNFPHVLAPTPAAVQPVQPAPTAPTQPVAPAANVQSAQQVVQQPVTATAAPAQTAAPAAVATQHVAPVQPAQLAAQTGAPAVSQPAPATQPMNPAPAAQQGSTAAVVDQVLEGLGIDTGDALNLL